MKAASAPPEPPRPDAHDIETLSDRLLALGDTLTAQAPSVANARTVREYDSERRKRALALSVREFIAAGDSATAADTKGRASIAFGEQLDALAGQLGAAEAVIAEHDATRAQFEAVRSVLSSLKAIAGNI